MNVTRETAVACLEVATADGRVEVVEHERLAADVERERQSLSVRLLALQPHVDRQRRQVDARRHHHVAQQDRLEEVQDDEATLRGCDAVDDERLRERCLEQVAGVRLLDGLGGALLGRRLLKT